MATNIYNPVSNSFNAFGGLVNAQSAIDLLNKWKIEECTINRIYTKTLQRDNTKLYRIGNIAFLYLDVCLASSDITGSTIQVYEMTLEPEASEVVFSESRNNYEHAIYITNSIVRISQRTGGAIQTIIPFVIDTGEVIVIE